MGALARILHSYETPRTQYPDTCKKNYELLQPFFEGYNLRWFGMHVPHRATSRGWGGVRLVLSNIKQVGSTLPLLHQLVARSLN